MQRSLGEKHEQLETDPEIEMSVDSSVGVEPSCGQSGDDGSFSRASATCSSTIYTRIDKINALEMIKDDSLWFKWMSNHKITGHTERWLDDDFARLMNAVSYPDCIKSTKVCHIFEELGYPGFQEWALQQLTEQDDPHQIGKCVESLALYWKSHANAVERRTGLASRRKGVEDMIELSFDLHLRGRHRYCCQTHLALPTSNTYPDPHDVEADVITIIRMPFDNFSKIFQAYSWYSLDDKYVQHPISFAFATKARSLADRQLTLYLSSAQHHRRAVGLLDIPLFGATLERSRFVLYVCIWNNDRLEVFPTGYEWNFLRAEDFMACYLHLSALAKYILSLHREAFEKSREGMKERQLKAAQSPWRRVDDICDPTPDEIQLVVDQIQSCKVAPDTVFPLTRINLRVFEALDELDEPSASSTEWIKEWAEEVATATRDVKRVREET